MSYETAELQRELDRLRDELRDLRYELGSCTSELRLRLAELENLATQRQRQFADLCTSTALRLDRIEHRLALHNPD